MVQQGIKLLVNYPKCSQDINPIEEAWRELRARLAQTDTTHMEGRGEFTVRLRAGVAWVNRNRRKLFKNICPSQKTQANLNPNYSKTHSVVGPISENKIAGLIFGPTTLDDINLTNCSEF